MLKLTEQPEVILAGIDDPKKREEFADYVARYPRECYVPNGENAKFVNAVAHSTEHTDVPVINCTFANGVGKSRGVEELIYNIVYGVENAWFDYPIFKKWKYPKTFWFVTTPSELTKKMEEIAGIMKPTAKISKMGKNYIARIKDNGFTIYGMSYQQDPSEFEGDTVGLIINDEPAPEPIWKAEKSRRRKGCISINIMTPLYVEPYIIQEYEKSQKEGRNTHFHVEGSVYGACKERGVRGHLDARIIDDMVADYDPDEREARVYGKFMYFSSHIYPTFKADVHIVNPDNIVVPEGSILKMINDPKDGKADAVCWGYVFPNGRKYIVGEYPFEHKQFYWDMKKPIPIDNMVRDWYDSEKVNEYNVTRRIMDKRFGWQTRGDTSLSLLYMKSAKKLSDELDERITMSFVPSYSSSGAKEGEIKYGHKMVRQALEIQPDGLPNLIISNRCFHTCEGMKNYIRKHDTSKASQDKSLIDSKIIDKFKDFPDVIRYFVCDGLSVPKKRKVVRQRRDDSRGVFSTL